MKNRITAKSIPEGVVGSSVHIATQEPPASITHSILKKIISALLNSFNSNPADLNQQGYGYEQ